MGSEPLSPPTREQLTLWYRERWIAAEETALREEDLRKLEELHGLLQVLQKSVRKGAAVVDAAGGKGYVALAVARFFHPSRVVCIERDERRAAQALAASLADTEAHAPVEVRIGAVESSELWPEEPDVVTALHACGAASDAVLQRALAHRARWLFLVPCCYADTVAFAGHARERARALGIDGHPAVRRRLLEALVDTERTLQLEAAGYECTVLPFVSPTITPHNLVWRARRVGPSKRSETARRSLEMLWGK